MENAQRHYAESVQESISTHSLGCRDFWRIANSILNRKKSTFPVLFNGLEVLTSPTDKVNLFADRFAANSTLDDLDRDLPDCPSRIDSSLSMINVTPKMVAKVISHLDTSKASGPDRIPAIVLKMCLPELSSILSKLCNLCLTHSVFPSDWKLASVVPVFKGLVAASDPSNYRSISLLLITSKVFESLINQQLIDFLKEHELLTDVQYGIRHSWSTGDILSLIKNT